MAIGISTITISTQTTARNGNRTKIVLKIPVPLCPALRIATREGGAVAATDRMRRVMPPIGLQLEIWEPLIARMPEPRQIGQTLEQQRIDQMPELLQTDRMLEMLRIDRQVVELHKTGQM